MAFGISKLARETAIYSISSIFGKFLNWLMVPLYTYVLANASDYGIITNLYSWTTLLLVVLTYGMETGFLRFYNSKQSNPEKVYSTSLVSLGLSSLLFVCVVLLFRTPVSVMIGYPDHPEYIVMLAIVVAMDAFCSIPFVYLRNSSRPVRFVIINMTGIFVKIGLNVFFLIVCPWLHTHYPDTISWFYRPDYGVGYIFIANLIATSLICLLLIPELKLRKFSFDTRLWQKMIRYSLPLLLLGLVAIMNQTIDKIVFPFLVPGAEGRSELGIYGATSKIAMVIMMFSQAFYYSYEPYIFSRYKKNNDLNAMAESMKFYILSALTLFLGIVLYMDILKYIIRSDYHSGLDVVPVLMFSFLLQGISLNLSVWYKLTDKTTYGALFSIIGIVLLLAGNFVLVPRYSYYGAAWASVICNFSIMIITWIAGNKVMPVKYDLKGIGLFSLLTIILFLVSLYLKIPNFILNILVKTFLMAVFLVLLVRREINLQTVPLLKRLINK